MNWLWIFCKKHYKNVYKFGVTSLVWIGIWSKYVVEIGKMHLRAQEIEVEKHIGLKK